MLEVFVVQNKNKHSRIKIFTADLFSEEKFYDLKLTKFSNCQDGRLLIVEVSFSVLVICAFFGASLNNFVQVFGKLSTGHSVSTYF